MRIKYYNCFQLLPHGNSSRLPSCIDICSWAHSGGGVRRLLYDVVPRGVVIIDHSMNGALWAPSLSSGTLLICMGLSPAGLSACTLYSPVYTLQNLFLVSGRTATGRMPLGFSKLQRTYLCLHIFDPSLKNCICITKYTAKCILQNGMRKFFYFYFKLN